MRILYVTTTFPVYSETFLQREARAWLQAGETLRIVSLHGGEADFEGMQIERFSKWRLWLLAARLPALILRRREAAGRIAGAMCSAKPTGWLNFWENLLGLGAALVLEDWIRGYKPDVIHCVWASAPAAFGMMASALGLGPFTMGAHAYDVYENGGDWMLRAKLRETACVHASTRAAAQRLAELGGGEKVVFARRGLNTFPPLKRLRTDRSTLRILCVARLVEKKGLHLQLEIYRRLKESGARFEAIVAGDGPLEDALARSLRDLGLTDCVALIGRQPQEEIARWLGWADALFHTGVVARSGDRDGLPNVIPEAMAAGAVVVASPTAGVTEAVIEGGTGFLRNPAEPESWVSLCRRLQEDDVACEAVRAGGRAWAEREFDAARNGALLLGEIRRRTGASFSRQDS